MSAERRNQKQPKPATARVFFALWPAPEVAEDLGHIGEAAALSIGGRATRRETIHLTLAFLGNIAETRLPALVEAAATVQGEPLALTIDRLGFWAHNHLIWAGCGAPHAVLNSLQTRLQGQLGQAGFRVGGAARAFAPHVTLVRHVPALAADPALPRIEPRRWQSDRFVLVRSTLSALGSSYQVIAEFPLAGRS